jgi:tripartite-type tricarboxylate transporter receptor subunit TctC
MRLLCNRVRALAIASVIAAGPALFSPAQAQSYPTKPVRFVIPYPPGGPSDILGRMVAQYLTDAWSVQVIADNRPGAGGNIGIEHCAKSPPDGYTLCLLSIGQTVTPALYPKLGFDPVKDFVHVSMLATLPSLLLVHPSLPVKSVKDLVALAKARPGALNYASAGNGSTSHVLMELLKLQTGTRIVHVPYKGTGPALIDGISGQIEVAFHAIISVQSYVRSGQLRAIGVSTRQRFPRMPEVPSLDEAGLKGFDGGSWQGAIMPARTSRDIVVKTNAELGKMLGSAETREKMLGMGAIVFASSPEELSAFVKTEVDKWAKVVKAAGIRAD